MCSMKRWESCRTGFRSVCFLCFMAVVLWSEANFLSSQAFASGLSRGYPQVVVFRGGTNAVVSHFDDFANVEVMHDAFVGTGLKPVESNYADSIDTVFHTRWASIGANNAQAQNVFPGHWLFNIGTLVTSSVDAASTRISVADTSLFSIDDRVVVYGCDSNNAPNWSITEEVIITNILSGTLELDRDAFWTTPQDWNVTSQNVRIASHVLIWNDLPNIWAINLSLESPVDTNGSATYYGHRFFADHFFTNLWMNRLDGSSTNVFINGFEFDGGRSVAAKGANQDNVDINNDFTPDGGYVYGLNLYRMGAIQCMQSLRAMMPTGVIMQVDSSTADFGYRGYKYVNGIEMENFPEAATGDFSVYSNYRARHTAMFSSAFLHLRQWVELIQQRSLADTNYYSPFSYGFTKEETETYTCGNVPALDPYGFPVNGHNSYFRIGLAAGLLLGMPHPYACENPLTGTKQFDFYEWDEYEGGDLADWDWLGQPIANATQVLDHLTGSVSLTNANWSSNFKDCAEGTFVSSNGTYSLHVSSVGTNASGGCTPVVGQALSIVTDSPLIPLITNGLTWADLSAPASTGAPLPKLYESTLTLSFSAMATNSNLGDGSAGALALQPQVTALGDGVPRLVHMRLVLKDSASNQLLPEQILLVPADGTFHPYRLSFPLEIYEDRFPTLEDVELTRISILSGEETGSLVITSPTIEYGSPERWVRYFDGGAVLLNASEDPWAYELEWPYGGGGPSARNWYHRLNGSQDPVINNGAAGTGALFRTFTVPPRDALLVRRLDDPLRLFISFEPGNMPRLRWKSYTGEVFSVHTSTNLVSGSFVEHTNGLTATPPTNSWIDLAPLQDSLFYRLGM